MAEPGFGHEHSNSKRKCWPPYSTDMFLGGALLCAVPGQMRLDHLRASRRCTWQSQPSKLTGSPSSQTDCLLCGSPGSRLYRLPVLNNPMCRDPLPIKGTLNIHRVQHCLNSIFTSLVVFLAVTSGFCHWLVHLFSPCSGRPVLQAVASWPWRRMQGRSRWAQREPQRTESHAHV